LLRPGDRASPVEGIQLRVKNCPQRADTGEMAASVATGSPLPESGVLQGGADGQVDALIEQSRQLAATPLGDRDRLASLLLAVPFLVVAVALALLADSTRHAGLWTFVVFVASYALASRIDFEVGTGSAVPTQLVLVPMLALLPVQDVPLCVVAGLLLGGLPDYARGRVPIARGVLRFVNSWHAVGPVIVLVAAGQPQPTPRNLPVYALAFVAQFGFDFGSTALRDRLGLGVSPWSLVRFMVWIWAVDLALTPIAILVALGCGAHPWLVVFSLPLMGLLAYFARERQVRIDHALELGHAYRGTAMLLGDVVEADDAYTGSHSRDVVTLVLDVAGRLGLDAREQRDAEFAALLHDIGKIKIPSEIINKPGKLTDEEWAIMKTHTVEGERLLSQIGGILGNVGRIVRSCHEDWDGTGYPDGLVAENIPLVARIVRACDAFSAMTTDRPYRKARPVDEAVAEVQRCSGTDFDPAVVEALAASLTG
jgi:HD-GYP domain-containing protein (c-di-GMP phosphodiesterase class II)